MSPLPLSPPLCGERSGEWLGGAAAPVQLFASPSDDYVFRPNSRAASNSPATPPGPSPCLSPQRGRERGISHHFDRRDRLACVVHRPVPSPRVGGGSGMV